MKTKTCYEFENSQFPIRLLQTAVDSFTVVYGKQIKKSLSYDDAATELGSCIMHALACEGELDNREKDEE